MGRLSGFAEQYHSGGSGRSLAYRPQPGERVGIVVSGGNSMAVDFDR
jgi:hypothetical protein